MAVSHVIATYQSFRYAFRPGVVLSAAIPPRCPRTPEDSLVSRTGHEITTASRRFP